MSDPYASIAAPISSPRPVVWTGTNAPVDSSAQAATVNELNAAGGLDPSQPQGSARNPYGLQPGSQVPGSAFYIDQGGAVHQAPPEGVNTLAPQSSDPYAGIGSAALAVSPGNDAAHSILPAIAKGAAGVLGLPGDATNLYGNIKDWWDNKTDNWMNGTNNPAPKPLDYAHPLNDLSHAMGGPQIGLPTTSRDFNNIIQNVVGDYYQPQTGAGRAVDTVGQMLPAALLPGGIATRIARVLVPAATSDAAGEVAHASAPNNPQAEAWARALGGLVGGGAQGFAEGVVNAPAALAAKGMEGVTPDHLDLMQALMKKAQGLGPNLTPAEALTQVGAGRLAPLQHYVENSHFGGPQTADFFQARPTQVSDAAHALADRLAAPTVQPSMIGARAQKAAQGGLDDVRQSINGLADPSYDALKTQDIPLSDYTNLSTSAAYQNALKTVRSNPILNEPIANLPDNNLAVVNEVKKQINQSATASAQTALNPLGNNQIAASFTGAGAKADALARGLSQDWADAHDIVSGGRAAYLDPLEAGPAGTIAKTDLVPAQTAALYPSKPMEGAPNETAQALRLIGTQDPDLGAALTRQHLMNSFNEASQDLQGGQNQYGGAKWIAQIAGNPEQRATLKSGLQTVDPNAAIHFDDLAEVLAATGKRMQPGSQTAFNEERRAAFGMSPTPVRTIGALVDPLEWGKAIDHAVGGAMYRRNISTLADMLTNYSPEQAAVFLSKAQSMSGNQGLATALLAGHQGANNP